MTYGNDISSGVQRVEWADGSFELHGAYDDLIASGMVMREWLPEAAPRKRGTARRRRYAAGRLIEAERLANGRCRIYVLTQSTLLQWARNDNQMRGLPADDGDAFRRMRVKDGSYWRFMRALGV